MSASLRTGRSKDERSGSWFDKLTTSECPSNTLARPEPFDSPLILSLSKDQRLAQDRPVARRAVGSWFDKLGIQPDPSRPRNDRGAMVTQLQGCRSAPRRLAVSGHGARWIRFAVSETSKEISKPGTRILSLSFTTGYN